MRADRVESTHRVPRGLVAAGLSGSPRRHERTDGIGARSTPSRRFVSCSSWKDRPTRPSAVTERIPVRRPGMRRIEARRIEEATARTLDRSLQAAERRGATTYRTSHGRKLTVSNGTGSGQS
jgi:hypothetical protein